MSHLVIYAHCYVYVLLTTWSLGRTSQELLGWGQFSSAIQRFAEEPAKTQSSNMYQSFHRQTMAKVHNLLVVHELLGLLQDMQQGITRRSYASSELGCSTCDVWDAMRQNSQLQSLSGEMGWESGLCPDLGPCFRLGAHGELFCFIGGNGHIGWWSF